MKETKIERDRLKNVFRKIVKRDVRYKLDVNDLNKNIKWDKKRIENISYWEAGTTLKEWWKEFPKSWVMIWKT